MTTAHHRSVVGNDGRRKVDPAAPPRIVEVEVDEARRESAERSERLERARKRFGPLRGDAPRAPR